MIQTCLQELALGLRVTGRAEYRAQLERLADALSPDRLDEANLPEEIHKAFVLVGLAVAHELAGHLIRRDLADAMLETIVLLAGQLAHDAHEAEWGRPVRRRAAWNHSIVPFSALGVASLAAPDAPGASSWGSLAVERTLRFFAHGVTAAGMTREGLAYCGFVFRNLGVFLAGARRSGRFDYRDPDQNRFIERLARIPDWYAAELFPRGCLFQNLNDSYWDPHPALGGFLPTFLPLRPGLAEAIWDRTVGERGDGSHGVDQGRANATVFDAALALVDPSGAQLPQELFFHCDDVGYVADWIDRDADNATGFSFNCGEYIGAIHDQSDNNSFTLFIDGAPVVIDAGARNFPEEGNASSSFGHNVVVVDGKGQLPAGWGYGVSGHLLHVDRDATRTIVGGDAVRSYNSLDYNPLRRAKRWCVFVKQPRPYLVVFDDIERDAEEHEFAFLVHTPLPAASEPRDGGVRMRLETDVDLLIAHPDGARLESDVFSSPGQPPFRTHTLWRVVARAVNPYFVVVLAPADAAGRMSVSVERGRRAIEVKVQTSAGGVDQIAFPRDGEGIPVFTRRSARRRERHKSEPDRPQPAAPVVDATAGASFRAVAAALDRMATDPGYPTAPERGVVMGSPIPGQYREIGMEFFRHFVTYGGLTPDARFLDIGCGGGRMAVPLLYYLDTGSYEGFDVHPESIAWCNEAIHTRDERFRFRHVDVLNPAYNPSGSSAEAFRFPYDDSAFDFAIAVSVFTHMFPDEVANYLRETFRVLAPGGTFFATAFLLTPMSMADMASRPGAVKFRTEHRGARIHDPERPAGAVALFAEQFFDQATQAGFVVHTHVAGQWPGREAELVTKQDIVVLRKPVG